MGEAKRQKLRHDLIRSGALPCIYCGGIIPGNQVDHMPPRIMFRFKKRPNDLYFPSCAACNQGSGPLDAIAAFFARMYPPINDPKERAERSTLIRAFQDNYPEVASGLYPEGNVVPKDIPLGSPIAMRTDDAYLNHTMQLFSTKVGLALHYHTTRKPLPTEGEVYPMWATNAHELAGQIPNQIIDLFPNLRTLEQGSWKVADQFSYASNSLNDQSQTVHIATFRQSFMTVTFVSTIQMPALHGKCIPHSPGCFKIGYPYGLPKLGTDELLDRFARMNDPSRR